MEKGSGKCPPKCRYWNAHGRFCEYYLRTKQHRGCPPGPDCIRYAEWDAADVRSRNNLDQFFGDDKTDRMKKHKREG